MVNDFRTPRGFTLGVVLLIRWFHFKNAFVKLSGGDLTHVGGVLGHKDMLLFSSLSKQSSFRCIKE